jgi:hypothetical protein
VPRAPRPDPPAAGDAADLAVHHRAITRGDAGASELVSVRVDGGAGASVTLHHGPRGGPYAEAALRPKSGGRFEGWLPLDGPAGGSVEYWITAEGAGGRVAAAGSRGSPFRVELR